MDSIYSGLSIYDESVDALIPYANNAKVHTESQIKQIANSILEFGFNDPIAVWGNEDGGLEIIEGHGRLLAAKRIGMTEVPVIRLDHLTDEQRREYTHIHNQLTMNTDFDFDVLEGEIEAFPDFDWESFGFDMESMFGMEPEHDIEEDEVPEDAESVVRNGDIWILGDHRLMCGDSTCLDDVAALSGGVLADLFLTDPPYNVAYEGGTADKLTIQNDDMEDEEFRQFLRDAYSAADAFMKPGAAFYIWHADSERYNFQGAALDIGWAVRECLIWAKNSMVLGRQDYQWRHEPCQPAGTMVRTPNGEVPIEKLKDGDRVVSFDTYSGSLKGLRDGLEIKTASRHYNGLMYSVSVGGKTTRVTDNHEFSVRMNANAKDKYCVYLMRRGNWWRIGTARTYTSRGFGIRERFRQENADEQWILTTCETASEAELNEQYIAVTYGIPYTCWDAESRRANTDYNVRSKEQIEEFYSRLDLEKLDMNANLLLAAYGRNRKYPLISKNKFSRMSRRATAKINACNLIPGLMQVPVQFAGYQVDETFEWEDITEIKFEPFDGTVYSLAVDKFKHYIADGIVTHNCLYGWKGGAAHNWYGDRKQTTVLEFDRPTANREHPTMKPVALFAYLIKNSSKRGDTVLDLFGGSGTTIIACEQLERKAIVMELDERYCDRIIKRWENLTGKKAVMERNVRDGQQ